MDTGTLRGIFAVVMLVLFLGIWAWAWSARRRNVFDAAARMPLEADDAPGDRLHGPQDNGRAGGGMGRS
jgi:cytochrome c oxidase cbb3-type subunit 4